MKTKQVIVIRKDLNMRKGKMVAQGSHASLGAVFSKSFVRQTEAGPEKVTPYEEVLEAWFNSSFVKICVACNSEAELLDLRAKAEQAGLLHCLIKDNGKTEFNGIPTYTALAIGPGGAEQIDIITGGLTLL